jgi:hypothetical protein
MTMFARNKVSPGPEPGSVYLALTRGLKALIDAADLELVGRFRWHAYTQSSGRNYVRSCPKRGTQLHLHRVILGAQDGYVVDHANGNSLDNRRSNLRLCTVQENCRNKSAYRDRKLAAGSYLGVSLSCGGNFQAQLRRGDGASVNLGVFAQAEDAARAYDAAAVEHFGEFAALNFPADCGLVPPASARIPRKMPPTHRGASHPRAVLDAEKVMAIRARLSSGEQVRSIARSFGVTDQCIAGVRDRKSWGHVA